MSFKFSDLLGQVLTKVENIDNEELVFTLSFGKKYRLYHEQDCCERVYIEDIVGSLVDLVGSPLLLVEEVSQSVNPDIGAVNENGESSTWTFYKLVTIKGGVTIRWYGESNGYYSERVDFGPVEKN